MQRSPGKVAREIKPWLSAVARIGFAAKGSIYLGVGLLALSLAAGCTGQAHDTRGAIEQLGEGAFGRVVLVGLAFGLMNFGLWNLVQCWWDPERVGVGWSGKALRVLFGLSAGLNFFLAYKTGAVAFGFTWGGKSGDETVKSWTETVLTWPAGRVLVLSIAAMVAILAVAQVVRLFRGRFMDVFSDSELKQAERRWVKVTARLGFAAQTIVAGGIAWFLWRAGITWDADESGSFPQVLTTLLQHPYGRWLVGFTALGVIARGVFIWLMVPYREIRMRNMPPSVGAWWQKAFGN